MAIGPLATPLILVLALSRADEGRLEALRRAHYPPARNRSPAHLTLIRHLPGTQAPALAGALRAEAVRTPPFDLHLAAPVARGNGVLLPVAGPELTDLHARLAERFALLLLPADRIPFAPHVTIAGKLPPAEARRLAGQLASDWKPWIARAQALALHAIAPDGRWTLLVRAALGR